MGRPAHPVPRRQVPFLIELADLAAIDAARGATPRNAWIVAACRWALCGGDTSVGHIAHPPLVTRSPVRRNPPSPSTEPPMRIPRPAPGSRLKKTKGTKP